MKVSCSRKQLQIKTAAEAEGFFHLGFSTLKTAAEAEGFLHLGFSTHKTAAEAEGFLQTGFFDPPGLLFRQRPFHPKTLAPAIGFKNQQT